MPFGWAAAATAAASVVSSYMASESAKDAANAQSASAAQGIAEQRRQFDQMNQLLAPYRDAGSGALSQQQNMLGLNGTAAQAQAMRDLENSPQFSALIRQGEQGILANASATGGLRGGNTQGALAQFRPAMLSALMNDQYARLGNMSQLGQNSAAMTGQAGMQSANAVGGLLQQQGAAQAGNALAQGRAWQSGMNGLAQAYGQYRGWNRGGRNTTVLGAQDDGFTTDPYAGI